MTYNFSLCAYGPINAKTQTTHNLTPKPLNTPHMRHIKSDQTSLALNFTPDPNPASLMLQTSNLCTFQTIPLKPCQISHVPMQTISF